MENAQVLGLSELRRDLMKAKKPFDYDTEAEGLRALDRYTFRILLAEPSPRFLYNLADGSFTGALARKVSRSTRRLQTRVAASSSSASRTASSVSRRGWRVARMATSDWPIPVI